MEKFKKRELLEAVASLMKVNDTISRNDRLNAEAVVNALTDCQETAITVGSCIEEHYGEVRFDGKKIDEVRDNCVVLFDDCPFYNKMSGIQNLLLFSEGMKSKDEIRAIGEKYLDYDLLLSKVCHYSNGQRKKLGIALIECLEPKYIFLDEISNGLDYVSLKQLRSRINEWAGNATIVMTGHQFDFYNNLVDELYILKDGIVLKETGYEKGIDRLEQSGDMSS